MSGRERIELQWVEVHQGVGPIKSGFGAVESIYISDTGRGALGFYDVIEVKYRGEPPVRYPAHQCFGWRLMERAA